MDKEIKQNNNPIQLLLPPPSTPRSRKIIRIFVFLLLIISITTPLIVAAIKAKKNQNQLRQLLTMPKPTPFPTQTTTPFPDDNNLNIYERIYSSPGNSYSFKVSTGSEYCDYSLMSNSGQSYDITAILNNGKIACTEGMGLISSTFWGWVSDNTLALEESPGIIKIVSLPDLSQYNYIYDHSQMDFVTVSDTQQYWLFEKKTTPKNKSQYIILGKEKNIIFDNLEFNLNDNEHVMGVFFDPANNGFLFAVRNYFDDPKTNQQMIFGRFDFFDIKKMALRSLLTTESVEAQGRGCGGYDSISSQPGEITVYISCLAVDDKNTGPDGGTIIKL